MSPAGTRTLLRAGGVDGEVRRTVVPGGLRVLTESVPGVRSACVGVWVDVGSRDERPGIAGASHYLEHLLFKGTRRRSALEISSVVEAVGGEINAFTTQEYTCVYARVLAADLALALDVVLDMATSSLLSGAEVEAERGVVLEEIAMHDDDPADVVHDAFAAALFGPAPLGRPVLGTAQSVAALSRRALAGHYRRHYRLPRMVVTVTGQVEHSATVRLVRQALGGAKGLAVDPSAAPAPLRPGRPSAPPARPARPVVVLDRPTEQANLVLGTIGLSRRDPRRFAFEVLNAALGGGMSSRLFQEIRERRGLAYSVYSFSSGFTDAGLFGVYVGCQPDRAAEVVEIIRAELDRVVRDGLTAEELDRGRGQLRGGVLLGLEDSGARMSRLGKAELVYGELLSADALVARVDAVSAEQVREVAEEVLTRPCTLAAIGPFDSDALAGAVA